ncbi:hypothetical protein AgCh_014730 [Apium graveolens]
MCKLGFAKKVFDGMLERSVVAWNSMISGYEQFGYATEAVALFCRMRDLGVEFNSATFVLGADLTHHQNVYGIANMSDILPSLPIDTISEDKIGMMMMMMMKGTTTKNFDPVRYSGRWFEVVSLKRGFAGAGQEDYHCTQCLSDEDLEKNVTDLEKQEMIKGKCYLRFPKLTFISKEPYDMIATDYDNYALVSGAKDKSFIQKINQGSSTKGGAALTTVMGSRCPGCSCANLWSSREQPKTTQLEYFMQLNSILV